MYQIDRIAHAAFKIARKRRGKLCSVDKANVLEVFITGLCHETYSGILRSFCLTIMCVQTEKRVHSRCLPIENGRCLKLLKLEIERFSHATKKILSCFLLFKIQFRLGVTDNF